MTKLRISPDLALPEEAVTRSFGILGMRGSGKSNAAVVLAEEMFAAGLHWVAIDPKGDWWGIRASADAKGPGLPVVIFGGEHADVALEPTAKAGILVADLVVNEGLTCVIDLSEFSKSHKIQFLAGVGAQEGFAGRLFRRKKRDQDPIHIFLEEAHDYVPQQARGEVAKLIDVVSSLQTMGRTKGLGCSILSQRSARVHKDVLTQVDTLVAFRTISPQDRDAVEAWVKHYGLSRELVASLPGLADGEAWIWSPEWLGTLERVRFRRRGTYDSGATPTIRGTKRAPATLADVDLAAINEQMAETIERAKADDPKELRRRIAELERELRARPTEAKVETVVERVEVPVLDPEDLRLLEKLGAEFWQVADGIGSAADRISHALGRWMQGTAVGAKQAGQESRRGSQTRGSAERPVVSLAAGTPVPTRRRGESGSAPAPPSPSDGGLSKAERLVLSVLAQYPQGRTKSQVALLAGYKATGGGFGNALGALRSKGFIQGRDVLSITDAGLAAIEGQWEALPTGPELRDYWMAHPKMGRAEKLILQAVADAYPGALTKQQIADATGYEASGGGFGNALGKLRSFELIEGYGEIRMSETLA